MSSKSGAWTVYVLTIQTFLGSESYLIIRRCLLKAESIIVVAMAIVAGISLFAVVSNRNQTADRNQNLISEDMVADHNTNNDCWTIINDNVYNVTDYVSGHPGREEILRACGTDASTLFNRRETNNGEQIGSGTPHSGHAASVLEEHKIGRLKR